jgi:pimeloyl-ACP methyl ester carboxylesterase
VPELSTEDGRRLHWREAGSGPPLLCHSGGPGFSSVCFGDLAELAAERTLLLLDPRGTGGSDRPSDRSAYDLEAYAADIEALREHLGLDRLDLLGHSHGGFVAMVWAGDHPDRVGRLVLASTTPRFTDAIREQRRQRVGSHHAQPYFADAMDALAAHNEGRYADDEELMDLFRRESVLFAPLGVDTSGVSGVLAVSGVNADALRHFNEQIAPGMDLRPLLRRIDAPTLVVAGELDPFATSAGEIAEALTDPTLVLLPATDHFPFLEPGRSGPWSRAVLDFLAG